MFERTKAFIKSTFPTGARAYRRVVEKRRAALADARTEVVFSEVYRNNTWENPESASGRRLALR